MEEQMYHIWSFEHQAWWKPCRQGYSILLSEAGRYPIKEAVEICKDANWRFICEYGVCEAIVPCPQLK